MQEVPGVCFDLRVPLAYRTCAVHEPKSNGQSLKCKFTLVAKPECKMGVSPSPFYFIASVPYADVFGLSSEVSFHSRSVRELSVILSLKTPLFTKIFEFFIF